MDYSRFPGYELVAKGLADLAELLAKDDSDSAYAHYNALIRELVSFERAAECAA